MPIRVGSPSSADPLATLCAMHAMENISRAFEWVAVAVLILAFALALLSVVRDLLQGTAGETTYRRGRAVLGRGILVGLEVLVAADLIRTVAVEPTLANAGVLGIIVLIRTVLSFSLDVEIEGVLPWRRVTPPRQSQSG
jgi:uncharacterized membrane protein